MKKTFAIALFILIPLSAFIAVKHFLKVEHRKYEKALFASLATRLDIPSTDNFYTKIDKVRRFVHSNSIHKVDEEFYSYWGKDDKIIELLHKKLDGTSETGPHLECSSRTGLMKNLLTSLGYETRKITVRKFRDGFPAHVFIDVRNPEDRSWHAQDPDYDIFWKIKSTNRRASIEDLIRLPQNQYEPCLTNDMCGWEIVNGEKRKPGQVKDSLGFALLTDTKTKERSILVNTKRFNLDAKIMVEGKAEAYCDYRPQDCKGKITRY